MDSSPKKVNVTRNYRMFARSEDNRALVPHKHKRLLESMRLYGFLPEFPIVCCRDANKHLIVKDGQHRLSIAETLGLPVYWIEESAAWDVAIVNSTQKGWVPRDYAERYARAGNADYLEGLDFMDANRLPIGLSFALLAGTTTFANIQAAFLRGEFRVKDRKWAASVAAIYRPFHAASKACRNARFIEACMAVCRVKEFEPDRLLHGLNRCREKLVAFSTRDAYLEMLEEIYNFGKRQLYPLKIAALTAMRERNAVKGGNDRRRNGRAA
jgi:hypothetical protein